ncbi:LPXTG cell wall anchor domain-containing protein [Streptomyces sp. NPDC006134]|uniref:LPXTG cell wall anchor domain-containing protein n=1 Tax=Streptomyces sp. NPDC006134 TaxID=3154467 RepID=UPI0033D3F7C4
MRILTRAGVLVCASSAALLLAPAAHATAPGDNGTVKIHDAATGEELRRNEPHVCTFYLDAFGFDGGQRVDWHIEAWAPTAAVKGETVKAGSLTLDAEGHGRTDDLSLPDGHYKLFWNFDGEKGSAKHKVFWTDCAEPEGAGEAPGTPEAPPSSPPATADAPPASPAPSDSSAPSGTPVPSDAPASSGTPSSSGSSAPAAASVPSASASASPQGGLEGDLAETGSGAPVGLLSAAAAALVAAGGYLVFRRRKAARG